MRCARRSQRLDLRDLVVAWTGDGPAGAVALRIGDGEGVDARDLLVMSSGLSGQVADDAPRPIVDVRGATVDA